MRIIIAPFGAAPKRFKFPGMRSAILLDARLLPCSRVLCASSVAACCALSADSGLAPLVLFCSLWPAVPQPASRPRPAPAQSPRPFIRARSSRRQRAGSSDMDQLAAKLSKSGRRICGRDAHKRRGPQGSTRNFEETLPGRQMRPTGHGNVSGKRINRSLTAISTGKMSERDFLREAKWNKVWGFPYSLYKGLIDWQKQRHMPVIGLNAPYPVVKKIARHGLSSLTPAERSQVARVFHLDDPADRERMKRRSWSTEDLR